MPEVLKNIEHSYDVEGTFVLGCEFLKRILIRWS
jgi:hypothetical protein